MDGEKRQSKWTVKIDNQNGRSKWTVNMDDKNGRHITGRFKTWRIFRSVSTISQNKQPFSTAKLNISIRPLSMNRLLLMDRPLSTDRPLFKDLLLECLSIFDLNSYLKSEQKFNSSRKSKRVGSPLNQTVSIDSEFVNIPV